MVDEAVSFVAVDNYNVLLCHNNATQHMKDNSFPNLIANYLKGQFTIVFPFTTLI